MKEFLPVLRNCALFHQIADADLPAMMACLGARTLSFRKKETIFEEGEPARYVGIVLAGKVQILQVDYFGNRSIMTTAGPSELFGESFACAGVEALPVTAMAAEDSRVLLVDCLRIMHSCGNACGFHQQMIYNLMRVVAMKNLQFHQKMEITGKRTTREKLLAYLMAQAKTAGSSRFRIPFDRQELADYLQVDRSGLSAEISRLRKEGVLKSERSTFELLQQ
ncbi:MAG: Crp/Fnr family transcriptional regulator [Clostridiales bacterium]|nr:Crp/Fnr family transcriptional regulator [Clostridiales bacterium]